MNLNKNKKYFCCCFFFRGRGGDGLGGRGGGYRVSEFLYKKKKTIRI